jgi:hypothetical protein
MEEEIEELEEKRSRVRRIGSALSESEKELIIKECDELMDLGIDYRDLPNYFDNVSLKQIEHLGIRSKARTRLTAIETRFCQEFVKCNDANKAMKIIQQDELLKDEKGAHVHGVDMLSRPKVRAKIKQLNEMADVDSAYVILGIKENIERCKQSRPVLDKFGEPVLIENAEGNLAAAYTFDANNVHKGLETLGKNIGLWTDNVKLSNDPKAPFTSKTLITTLPADPIEASEIYTDFMKE